MDNLLRVYRREMASELASLPENVLHYIHALERELGLSQNIGTSQEFEVLRQIAIRNPQGYAAQLSGVHKYSKRKEFYQFMLLVDGEGSSFEEAWQDAQYRVESEIDEILPTASWPV